MKKPCSVPGCPNLVERGNCGHHSIPDASRQYDEWRGSSSARGYNAAWQRFRRMFLRRNPWCADCADDLKLQATEVHHVKKVREYPHLRLVESNCMALCKSHHSERTARGE